MILRLGTSAEHDQGSVYENLVDRGGNELTMVMGLAYCCAVYPLDQLVFARNGSRGGACPPPRNVAAQELAITDSLKSATLWGGVGGGETRQITVSRPSGP